VNSKQQIGGNVHATLESATNQTVNERRLKLFFEAFLFGDGFLRIVFHQFVPVETQFDSLHDFAGFAVFFTFRKAFYFFVFKLPFGEKPVAVESDVFRLIAGSRIIRAVKIWLVMFDDRAEFFQIKISVPRLHRLKSPLNVFYAFFQCRFALRPF